MWWWWKKTAIKQAAAWCHVYLAIGVKRGAYLFVMHVASKPVFFISFSLICVPRLLLIVLHKAWHLLRVANWSISENSLTCFSYYNNSKDEREDKGKKSRQCLKRQKLNGTRNNGNERERKIKWRVGDTRACDTKLCGVEETWKCHILCCSFSFLQHQQRSLSLFYSQS